MSDKKFKPKNEFRKCAPNKNYDSNNDTCFTLEQVIEMVKSYNNSINNKNKQIILDNKNLNKKILLDQLIKKLPKNCNSQECLLKEDFIVNIDNFDLKFNTLRPLGPNNKTKWLSSSDINQIMIQYTYKYDDFIFFGALPIDFEEIELPINYKHLYRYLTNMYKDNIYKIGFVFNLDNSKGTGSHWVALYLNLKKEQIYFFDSYGTPPVDEIISLMSKIAYWIIIKKYNKNILIENYKINFNNNGICKYENFNIDIRYNILRHQYKNSECGVYSINFILRLLKGDNFELITEEKTRDDDINNCRKTYFRFNFDNNDK
jgi:hypothetical protein